MTAVEAAKLFNLPPKDVTAFIQENATFYVKRNFQTGDIMIPDNVDIAAFLKPLIDQEDQQRQEERLKKDQLAVNIKIRQANIERQEAEQQNTITLETLRQMGAEGYYQYKVISLMDIGGLFKSNSGRVNTDAMTQTLNQLGMEGWHLVTAYSNELGKNAMSGGAGGVLLGVNSTVDENILIFERFVKF